MECHDYTPCRRGRAATGAEFVYKLNPVEIQDFVKLRMSNKNLFGKKHSAMYGWRAIVRHMGLQDKMTHYQASKKWENMKKRYKDIKCSGMESLPQWRYFPLMNDAMEGRLDSSAPLLSTTINDLVDVLNGPKRKRKFCIPMPSIGSVVSLAPSVSPAFDLLSGPEVEVAANGEGPEEKPKKEQITVEHTMQKVDNETHLMDRQKQMMEREHLLLQRERAGVDRSIAALERDRASLDRDRAAIEREKALLDRERAMMEKEREAIAKDRQALELEKARLVRTQEASDISDHTERRERFLILFEKLINSF